VPAKTFSELSSAWLNRLKSVLRVASFIPIPESLTIRVSSLAVVSNLISTMTNPDFGVNLIAFETKLLNTCPNNCLSAIT
jgi:hypothetical protein